MRANFRPVHADDSVDPRDGILPMRPEGADRWSINDLAALVKRDYMIGLWLSRKPEIKTGWVFVLVWHSVFQPNRLRRV